MSIRWLRVVILTFICSCSFILAKAQSSFCPGNINFEQGNLANWSFDTALNAGSGVINSITTTGALANRHVLTSGTGTDYYGGFPVVDPQGGSYSLKLGNDQVHKQVDRARYTFTIPSTVTNYSIVYRYAVVFEDPNHANGDQPYFKVRVYNANTGVTISCASFTFVSQPGLNGFSTSTHNGVYGGATVYYKPWSTASLNLSGQAGNTLVLEFTASDCALGAHMGYGYVDVLCPNFNISGTSCNSTTTLSAPTGFQYYTWYNANYTTMLGTGQTVTLATPTTLTNYHVVVTPYAGTGCQDTLLAQLRGSALTANAGPDTMLCNNQSIVLTPTVTGNTPPLTYNWTPSTGLSCTSCLNPVASPTVNTNYVLTVTDSLGCSRTDTVNVKAKVALAVTSTNPLCFGATTGTANAAASLGVSPYTYSWNTTPVQTGPGATGLGAGTYTVIATDTKGCTATQSVTITQPTKVTAAVLTADSVSCFGGSNGQAIASATGGMGAYTYSWNTTPLQTTATATGLSAGTYIVTVKDVNNCADTESVIIKQPALLTAIATKTDVTCYGGNNGNAQVSVTGGTTPYTYSWNSVPAQTTATATGLTAGTYTITATDAKGCVATQTLTIAQPTKVTAAITAIDSVSCYGGSNGQASAMATGGTAPYTYSWNTTPLQITATATGLSAGSYIVTVRDINNCPDTASVIVRQPAMLAVTTTKTNVSCFGGNNGSALVTATGGNAPYTYSWNTVPAQTTATATGLAAESYTVTATDTKGCVATGAVIITQPTKVTASITATDSVSCYGGSNGQATVVATGGIAPYTYSWNTTPLQTTLTATGLPAGTYIVTVKDVNNCADTESVQVRQPAPLSVTVTKTNVFCNGGANGTAQASVTGGNPPYTYSWTGNSSTTSSTTGLAAGSYTVIVTDHKGCTATATVSIAQPTALTAVATATPPTCYNGTNGTATVLGNGGTGAYTYAWSTTPLQTTATAQSLAVGSYTVTITDSLGCTANTIATVPQQLPITLTTTSTSVTCFGKSDGTATAAATSGTGPYTYSWNTTPVQTGAMAVGLTSGNYIVTATSSNGCTGTGVVYIPQPTKLTVTATTKATCPGSRQGAAIATAAGGTTPYTYSWSTNPVQTNAIATSLPAGTYTIQVTDNNGCLDSAVTTVGLFQPPHITATADSVICRGKAANLNATGAQYYSWSPAAYVTCDNCSTTLAYPDSNYVFSVTGTDSNGCKDTAEVRVLVIQHVAVSTAPRLEVCPGDAVRLGVTGGIAWQWIPENSVDSAHSTHTFAHPQTTTIYNVVVTENECFKDTLSQEVTVIPFPTVNLGPDIEAATGGEVTLNAQTTNVVSIAWSPITGLSCTDCYTPHFTMGGKVTYIATVANKLGCKGSDTITIFPICDARYFFFANMFTPNGDGHNDRFYPQALASSLVQHFMIYDRWGEIVYSASNIMANDESAGWDGTYRGQALKPDVYVYVLDATCEDGGKIVTRGDVTLIR